MELGVFAMIPQLNAKVLNGSHQHNQKAKKVHLQKSKVKTMLVCFDSKGIIHHKFVPHWKFIFECSGTPMEEDSPCSARVLSTRQLVSSS